MDLGDIGRMAAMLAFGWLLLVGHRYVRARSTVLGLVLGVGIVVRAALGVALFAVSYLHLPIAESLQLGDGFWQPALDAAGYYERAASAADAGTLFEGPSAAPFYVDTLALWMNVVGVSPAAAIFLNLCLYVALMVSLVWFFRPVNEWRHDLPCIVAVIAYSFSPIALFHSTQPLKDELFGVLVAMACLGMLGIGRLMYRSTGASQSRAVAAGTLAVTAAIVAGSGIRWYYPAIVWSALALVFTTFAIVGRTTPLSRYLAGSAAVLLGIWLGFWAGAGSYYWAVAPEFNSIAEFPSRLATFVEVSRTGFLTSGGGTNIVVPLRSDEGAGEARAEQLNQASHDFAVRLTQRRPAAEVAAEVAAAEVAAAAAAARSPSPQAPASGSPAPASGSPAPPTAPAAPAPEPLVDPSRAIPVTVLDQLSALATGLGLVFVPISLMQKVLGVDLPGGRGLLAFADVDTIYMDVVTLVVLTLVWRRRHAIGDRLPFVVFGLTLSAVTALLLGYVVTNYGTLWRMRLLVTIPLWVVVVALSPRARTATGAPPEAPLAT